MERGKLPMNQTDEPSTEQLIAQRFLQVPAHAIECRPIVSGFSGAGIMQVSTSTESYALRRWSRPSLPRQRILELHRFLVYLKSHEIPVAVPLLEPESRSSLVFKNQTYWQLEPWLPGKGLTGPTIGHSATQSMMQSLARMHLAAEKYISSPQGTEWFGTSHGPAPAVIERLRMIEQWTPRRIKDCKEALQFSPEKFRDLAMSILEQYQRHSERVAKQLQTLATSRCQLFPCWRDPWRDHVLFLNGKVSGFIDASATRCDHVGTDLSRLLGSMFADDQQLWQHALSDYQQVRKLSPLDLELAKVLDRSSVLLSGMTWIDRWEKQTLNHNQLPAIIERLKAIEKRMHSQ